MRQNTLFLIFLSMRPRQWTKNLIIFAPLLFSQNLLTPGFSLKSALAFLFFCILSGCVYLLNDLIDLEQDKRHPIKSKRPLASGKLKRSSAIIALIVLLVFSFSSSIAFLNIPFIITAAVYLLLQDQDQSVIPPMVQSLSAHHSYTAGLLNCLKPRFWRPGFLKMERSRAKQPRTLFLYPNPEICPPFPYPPITIFY